ncbi:hypothetical protein ACQ5SP_08280 [Rhodovulum sp. YNF3179]|uniref:hypothetical protein n=1 Tax=Rhodovulum sp. YNF3179 TaxID=3425127 RepID=UPI003D328129
MRFLISGLVAGSLVFGSAHPSAAMTDEQKAGLAAAAILGIAALAHHNKHYQGEYRPQGAQEKAMFEAGYRDGLHDVRFDTGYGSRAYSEGYAAGHKERENRLAHKQGHAQKVRVPSAAIAACRDEAVSSLGVRMRDVHIVNAGQEGSDNYYIELAAGHHHVVCGTSGNGQVFNLRDGRL